VSGSKPPDVATVARLVAVLLITEDDDLAGFRLRCLGRDSAVDLDKLRMARELLADVGALVAAGDDKDWGALLAAHGLLKGSQPARAGEPDRLPAIGDRPAPAAAAPAPIAAPMPAPAPVAQPARAPRAATLMFGSVSSTGSSPWARGASPPVTSAPPQPVPMSGPTPAAPGADREMTFVGHVAAPATNATPFSGTSAGPAQPPVALAAEQERSSHDSQGTPETAIVDRSILAGALGKSATPFDKGSRNTKEQPSAAAPARELSLEEFAWLLVNIEKRGGNSQQATQYGIPDAASWQAVEQLWQQRVAADAELRARFHALVTHYRESLSR
jgi:hypothetical protein